MLRLAGVLALALALCACGESTEEKYEDGFPPIDRGLVALGRDVGEGLRGAGESGDRALAGEFGVYARRLERLRERLGELEPPGPLERDHEAALDAAASAHTALTGVAAAVRAGDAAAARGAATRLVRAGAHLEDARSRLARRVRAL